MGYFKCLFATAFLLLMLVIATGTGDPILCQDEGNEKGPSRRVTMEPIRRGKTCESPSRRFKGRCTRQIDCAAVCQTEGYRGGQCKDRGFGFHERCFCTKPCKIIPISNM